MVNRVEQMKKIQNEALELFTKKNIDYGDAFAKYGVIVGEIPTIDFTSS